MQKNNFLFDDVIDSNVSEYYDNEMPEVFLMNYEARMAQSIFVQNYTYDNCFEFFKISNSIKLAKIRLKDKSSKITDEILAKIKALNADADKISKEMQSVVSEYEKIKKTTKAAQVQYKENADKYKELEASYQVEKDALEKELSLLSKSVEPSLMERYLKKRADKMYPILYAVKNDACGACRMNLSMSDMNKLKNGAVIDCEQCGRMIYIEQE